MYEYVNADDIKRTTLCSDIEAALKAEELRELMIAQKKDFTFETVLSTERNLLLLQKAKEQGYFVRGIYVLTANVDINVARVSAREALGGHGVPEEKIRIRYERASLAVQKANYAVKMYENVGFKKVDENDEEYIMVCEL